MEQSCCAAAARTRAHQSETRHCWDEFVSPTVVPMYLAGRMVEASRPAGASREHDTRRLHAMAPGLVGQGIERAGGSRKDTALGLLEASGLVPRSRLRGIRVGFFGDHVGHQVLAVDGQTLEQLTLIAGGQRVDDDAVLHDAGKALLKIGAVHRVVQTPLGLGSVEQRYQGTEGPLRLGRSSHCAHPMAARKLRVAKARWNWESAKALNLSKRAAGSGQRERALPRDGKHPRARAARRAVSVTAGP